jgi:hypothetical protein
LAANAEGTPPIRTIFRRSRSPMSSGKRSSAHMDGDSMLT